jgi:(2Fe-2S) ferredoxin
MLCLQISKAKLADSPALMAELNSAMKALHETRCELDDALSRMAAAGCVDVCSSSSSSSSDGGDMKKAQAQTFDAAAGVPLMLRAQPQASVSVCDGKACRRKGADEVHEQLQQRLGPQGVTMQRCSCLDMCKMGPNVQVDQARKDTFFVNGVSLECVTAPDVDEARKAVVA